MDQAEALMHEVESMRVRGASAIARVVAEVFVRQIEESGNLATEDLAVKLQETCDWALRTKPSMSPVVRVVFLVQRALEGGSPNHDFAVALRRTLEDFIRRSERSVEDIGQRASLISQDRSVVVVHSFSGALVSALKGLAAQSPGLVMRFTESRPLRESRFFLQELAGIPLRKELYTDASMDVALEGADLVLLGADAIYADGRFCNKVGSKLMALAAFHRHVPVYVISESLKVIPDELAGLVSMEMRPASEVLEDWQGVDTTGVDVVNQFFEVTPREFVTGYLTEDGLFSPEEVSRYAQV